MKPRHLTYAKTFLPFLAATITMRCDSVAFARSFEFVEKELQQTEFAPTKSEQFIPYDTSVPAGALTVTHRLVTQVGQADFVDHYADDLPYVDVKAEEFSVDCKLLGEKYMWTVEELENVALDPTIKLDAERKRSAVDAMKRKHDEIAAIGSTKFSKKGFINATVVPFVVPVTGDFGGAATDDQIVADLKKLIDAPRVATKDNNQADTLLVDDATWERINRPYGDDKNTTIRKWLLENVDGLKTIAPWSRLNLADAEGNGPRLIAYKKTKEVVKYFSVVTFRELPPQYRNLKVEVPCTGKTGFTNWRLPLAAAYMDGSWDA